MPLLPTFSRPESPAPALTAAEFRKRLRWLIFHTWNIPPVFGLGFILLIGVLTPEQMLGILSTPLEPAYIIGWLVFAVWFLPRSMQPLADWLDSKPGSTPEAAVRAVQRFPLRYWTTFIVYLALAPASVIWAAEHYTGFVATPYDWFRIELVALIVSIIVGLPIFFLVFDLFGRALGGLTLARPIITVRTKVFLIGALVPLLIDTMLVQYYWTRTGYFTFETFGVWVLLELLAIGGSLIFAHSFGQSLAPLQRLIGVPRPLPVASATALRPQSTDELGLLTADFRQLFEELSQRNEILDFNNRLLRTVGVTEDTGAALTAVVELCNEALAADQAFLLVLDEASGDLVCVAQSGDGYRAEGHWRARTGAPSLARWAFEHDETVQVEDMASDPRVSHEIRAQFGTRSAILAVIRRAGHKLGLLTAIQRAAPRRYSARDVAVLEGLAREAAAVLHSQQLRVARQQAEQTLRESETKYRLLFENMTSGFALHEIICDAQGKPVDYRYLEVNPAFEKQTGVPPSALLGKTLREVMPNTENYWIETFGRVALTGEPTAYENYSRELGRYYDTWVFSPRPGQFAVVFSDISERKRAEAELQRHREHLEELVLQRTAELESVNRELEAFSYSVSHDLRAPLRAVDGFARALEEDYAGRLDATARDYLQRIRQGSQRMGFLIDDLLELSRVGRATLQPVEIFLSDVARDIINRLAAAEPGRQVRVDIAPGLTARGDARLMQIALSNLLDNAWKYTSQTPDAHIEFLMEERDGTQVFCIRDNGAGFDMQYASKLFGAFQRLHGAEFPGTGIGLATVQRIIHRHGGRVWAEGRPGAGATFYFTLGSATPG